MTATKSKIVIRVIFVVFSVVVCLAIYLFRPSQRKEPSDITSEDKTSGMTFKDEPEARALYEKMIDTMRNAETLSYTSDYMWENKDRQIGRCTYTIWMKKPNYFCVETVTEDSKKGGIIVGDGDYLWIYWPTKRPRFAVEEERESYEKTNSNVYMKKAAPRGKHSIGHELAGLGAGMCMSIIDPSTFHGSTDTLEHYIDRIRSIGTEKVSDEECDVIEVSFMKRQRSWYLWLSRKDHLPRKLKQVVRAANDIIMHELWSQVTINAEISMDKFAWVPPESWQQWSLPEPDEDLIKPGQKAPDFKLLSYDGKSIIKLSDYRGKVVWFYIWKAGCPVCREEMRHLQELHYKYKDKGVVILGFNCVDDKQIAMDFLRENSATFPNILDLSDDAIGVGIVLYKGSTVPLNYIIDRKGKVVDAWYGYEEGHKRAFTALKMAGLKLEGE